jgi:hypothetical protein
MAHARGVKEEKYGPVDEEGLMKVGALACQRVFRFKTGLRRYQRDLAIGSGTDQVINKSAAVIINTAPISSIL